jgi:hypothetical protein
MALNFGQFAYPTLPIQATDVIGGYQLLVTGPKCTQYTFEQLGAFVFPLITPAEFAAMLQAWFNTLSMTLPKTSGVLWNNDGVLSLS